MDPSHKPSSFSTHESWHQAILISLSPSISSASSSSGRSKKLIYSYTHALHGFGAVLTPELAEIEKSPAHRATLKERLGKALTSTPHFLGLDYKSGVWPATSYGHDTIIGILDNEIWPESESFNDRKYDAVPKRWKGSCENGASSFNRSMCNRKLIGARYYYKGFEARTGRKVREEYKSPRDFEGHGTHTASTAAGSFVSNVSYFRYARGTAKGIAAGARLAIYKVIWFNLVVTSDVVAAMDQAMADGVDIISLSIEFKTSPYHADPLAIAALKAVNKGIYVVCAARNHGLAKSTHNGAPWITTVGASTIDRNFSAQLSLGKLGNNYLKLIKCTSYYPRIGCIWIHGSRIPKTIVRGKYSATSRNWNRAIWLPQYHDMGLIGGLFTALVSGGSAVLFSPIAFIKNPLMWLDTMSKYRATHSAGPNFAFELVVRRLETDAEKVQDFDLSSMIFLMVAAEPGRQKTLKRGDGSGIRFGGELRLRELCIRGRKTHFGRLARQSLLRIRWFR
ncbi:hypothetical protein H6P81_002116 [Aristolochia fimbriata]|uniref:Uncharacterized protein n=1 Tax=Aristolochia fimbriata TaxID=158543 RepID=A0AAV7FDG2_ARIFI|nr:hypothetical protein H6P81_002116 [Aristolochia fimbriata]